jgi:hypothetical protein
MRWRLGLTLIITVISILLTNWPINWQPFLEVAYGEQLYPAIQKILSYTPSFDAFATSDILWVLVPTLFIIRIVLLLRQNLIKRTLNIVIEAALWASTGYFLMMLLWGMNYHREPLYAHLKQQGFTTNLVSGHWQFAVNETEKVLAELPADFDFCPQGSQQFSQDRPSAFAHSAMALANLRVAPPRSVIPSAWSSVLTRLGTAGVYIPFTGEPTISSKIFEHSKPFVMTHEYGHWAGYAREYDADILGYWSLWLSPDPIWQYSAWLVWWSEIAAPREYYNAMPTKFKKGIDCYIDHIRQQPRWEVRKLFWRVYESNLKNQGISEGLKSYKMGESMALTSYQDWLHKKANR